MNLDIHKVKICVTAPPDNIHEIRDAMTRGGAGIIGNYSYCSIASKCIGTFKGNKNSKPYIGEKNELEKIEEIKLEMSCDIKNAQVVIKAIKEVHPYEEPVIEIIPLLVEKDLK